MLLLVNILALISTLIFIQFCCYYCSFIVRVQMYKTVVYMNRERVCERKRNFPMAETLDCSSSSMCSSDCGAAALAQFIWAAGWCASAGGMWAAAATRAAGCVSAPASRGTSAPPPSASPGRPARTAAQWKHARHSEDWRVNEWRTRAD